MCRHSRLAWPSFLFEEIKPVSLIHVCVSSIQRKTFYCCLSHYWKLDEKIEDVYSKVT